MSINKKIVGLGLAGMLALNPLTVNLVADAIVIVIEMAKQYLVLASGYMLAVSATLVVVGLVLMYAEGKQKDSKKLESLKKKKTQKAGEYLA